MYNKNESANGNSVCYAYGVFRALKTEKNCAEVGGLRSVKWATPYGRSASFHAAHPVGTLKWCNKTVDD